MRTIVVNKLNKEEKLPLDCLPVKLIFSDGSEILVDRRSFWRIKRQDKGGNREQVYLIDRRGKKIMGRKLLLEYEELILGRARNPVYFGHSKWGRGLKMEEARLRLKDDCVYVGKI